jgi:hypothetical protein
MIVAWEVFVNENFAKICVVFFIWWVFKFTSRQKGVLDITNKTYRNDIKAILLKVTSNIHILNSHYAHYVFLIGRFLKIFSETAWPSEPKLGRKHLYKECSFCSDPLTNIVVTANSIGASYQISILLAIRFQWRRFF